MITDQMKLYENSRWIQLAYNLFFIGVWYLANDGLAFWDDFTYLNFADQVNKGTFEITRNHFTSRVAMIYPVAKVISILGINSLTITVFPLFCALVVLNLLFYLGRRINIWLGLIGGLLIVCDYHMIIFSTHLFPELPMTLYVLLALVSYDTINRREGDHRFLALLTALSIFGAFLTKTTIFLLIPLFVFLFWNDWFRRRKHRSYWLITAVTLVFFVVLNGVFYYETKGDFFYRFSNISNNHEATVKTFFDKSSLEIIKRLTYLPLLGFTRGGFFIPLIIALPALFSIKKASWRLDDAKSLWPVSIVFILAAWWFMSTNWKFYSPMPLDTRHITFIIPLFIISGVNWWTNHDLFKKYASVKWSFLLLIPFLAIPAYRILKADDRHFNDLEKAFQQKVLPSKEIGTVFTDGLISYGYPYFYNFEDTDQSFEWFSETYMEIEKGDAILINPAYLNDRYSDNGNLDALIKRATSLGDLDCDKIGEIKWCVLK